MSAVPQQHLLAILTQMCNEVAKERQPIKNYDRELFRHLVEIVAAERAHLARPGHIQKQINDKVDTLGQVIFGEEGSVAS
jgi:hypothetical protein